MLDGHLLSPLRQNNKYTTIFWRQTRVLPFPPTIFDSPEWRRQHAEGVQGAIMGIPNFTVTHLLFADDFFHLLITTSYRPCLSN
jgi:hypothetical protein